MYLLLINVFLGNSAILFYQINDVVMQMFCFLYTGWNLKTLSSSGYQLYKLDEFLGTAPPSIFVCVVFFNVLSHGKLKEQSLAPNTRGCWKRTSGIPDTSSPGLWDRMRWMFQFIWKESNCFCINDKKQNLVHSRCIISVLSKWPESIMSLKIFLQYWVKCLFKKLHSISIRWFAVDRPTEKLFQPLILSVWYERRATWMSMIRVFSEPPSHRTSLGMRPLSIR